MVTMKNCVKMLLLSAVFTIAGGTASFAWEPYDKIIAIVNGSPILESEVVERYNRLARQKGFPAGAHKVQMSRLLDKFIEEAIVLQEAQEQSIVISDEKIDNHLKKIAARMHIGVKEYKERIEKTENIKFEDYKEEIRRALITEQVMSLAIGVSPPTKKEAMDWYKANRDKLGFEVNLKHILLKPKNTTLAEEKRVNEETKRLHQRILRGESFETAAANFSEDPASAKKGGDMGWVVLAELDPYFANQVYRMAQTGQATGVVKSAYGYHIVRLTGKRPISYDSVEDKIVNLLFQHKVAEQFVKWVHQRRKESEVKIYMQNYVKS